MLDSFRKGQRWLTLIFVASIGVVFIFFFGSGGGGLGPAGPTGSSIVELDEIKLTSRDFSRQQRLTENQLRQQLGEAYDQVGANRYVDAQALSAMINSVVLAAAAEDLGLHVTTDEVRRVVQTSPSFIDSEGKFSPIAFNNFAESEYGTQRSFIRSFTRSLLGQKLIQVLAAQTTVSDAEIDLLSRFEQEEVRIAYVAIDGTNLPEGETVSDEDVEAWAEANETALRATFNERAPNMATPDRVRARHILVRVASDADEEEVAVARTKVDEARVRIEAGEEFTAVAETVSDDVATAALGGDLGTFEQGDNAPAIDDAAFSLEAGGLSEAVRSEYGFHLVRVEERLEATTATWDGSRLVLAREGAESDRAQALSEERATQIAEAVMGGQSLEDAVRQVGLTLERPAGLKRRPDGFVPGLGVAPQLLTAAFSLEAGVSSPEVYDVAGRQILIQVLERTALDDEALDATREERRSQVLDQKQNQIIDRWLTDYRRQLEEAGRLRVNAELALGTS